MFYNVYNNAITLKSLENFTMFQDFNPSTNKYFLDNEEAKEWAFNYVSSIHGKSFFELLITSNVLFEEVYKLEVNIESNVDNNEEVIIELINVDKNNEIVHIFTERFVEGKIAINKEINLEGNYILNVKNDKMLFFQNEIESNLIIKTQ